MTRKRYIKLLMACGYSRNRCKRFAEVAREFGSYCGDLIDWAHGFSDVARNRFEDEAVRKRYRRSANILRYALHVEVLHE